MCRAKEDSQLQKVVISVSSVVLAGLLQKTIVVQELPLNIVHIIRFSRYFLGDFKSRGLRIIRTLSLAALTEFFNEDAERNVQTLPVSILDHYSNIYVLTRI